MKCCEYALWSVSPWRIQYNQDDQNLEENRPTFESSQNICRAKKCQNISHQPTFESQYTYNKLCFETLKLPTFG